MIRTNRIQWTVGNRPSAMGNHAVRSLMVTALTETARLRSRLIMVAALIVATMLAATDFALAQSGGGYVITKSTVDSGGSTSLTGGSYTLGGTVGQSDAGAVAGGAYSLTGGFWSRPSASAPPSPQTGNDTCVGGTSAGNPCSQHSDCPGGFCQLKNRFITAVIPATATAHGIKVTLVNIDANSVATPSNYNGTDRWVGAPSLAVSDGTSPSFNAAKLQCVFTSQNWSAVGPLHIYGDVVVPGSTYDAFVCSAQAGPCSAALRIGTAKWGDIIAPLNVTNFQDIVAVVTKFQGVQPPPAAPSKTRTKLNEPVNPAPLVNFQDIAANVAAFQGVLYKNKFPTPPLTCP